MERGDKQDHALRICPEWKFRSFELYRRQTFRPEILTFDELFDRTKFIVNHESEPVDDNDGIPF